MPNASKEVGVWEGGVPSSQRVGSVPRPQKIPENATFLFDLI